MALFLDQDRLVLARIERAILELKRQVNLLTEVIMATMDDVRARVEAQRTVTASVVTLLDDIRRRLEAATAASDPAALEALASSIEENTRSLAAAVVSGTPASKPGGGEPPPTAVVTPPPEGLPVEQAKVE